MSGIRVTGDLLLQASTALRNAGAAFAGAGTVSLGADYGAGGVDAALLEFRTALATATGVAEQDASAKGQLAQQTHASFIALDTQIAAKVSALGVHG